MNKIQQEGGPTYRLNEEARQDLIKKSRNDDTLGPVELIVCLEKCNQIDQGDQCEQDDQGEVSIIIFAMSESSGFQKCQVFQALCLCFRLCHFICLCICVLL